MATTSGAAGGEVLFSGSVTLSLTTPDGVTLFAQGQDPTLDATEVRIQRTTTRTTTQNVSSTRKKQHTMDFQYQATFTGNMVGQGFAYLAKAVDGELVDGKRPPRLTATVTVPPQGPNGTTPVAGFTATLKNGDLDTVDITIPTSGALTQSASIIFDTLE